MTDKTGLLLKIFRAELEDLEEDLGSWLESLEDRHRQHQVSEYVYRENTAVLKQEIRSLDQLALSLAEVPAGRFSSPKDLADELRRLIAAEVKSFQFPEAVQRFAERKLVKVLRYLTADD